MKKRILKLALVTVLILSFVLGLASCASGGKMPDAKDADGEIEGTDIKWTYTADDNTLEISGSGVISFESAEDVAWYDVRHSVEEVELSDEITELGDYSFYYFPKLEKIKIPASVTALGDCAFAFCSSLDKIDIPESVTSIGDSCFEMCTAMEVVFVPASVTELGERAFMNCTALTTARIVGPITELKSDTFYGCTKLKTVGVYKDVLGQLSVADSALPEEIKTSEVSLLNGKSVLTIKYLFEEDESAAAEDVVKELDYGDEYSEKSPTIEGYVASRLTVAGVMGDDETVIVTYKKEVVTEETEAETQADEQTEAAADGEESEGITPMNIIMIVVFAVVIVGIIVLAIIMMRSDKKDKNGKGGKK